MSQSSTASGARSSPKITLPSRTSPQSSTGSDSTRGSVGATPRERVDERGNRRAAARPVEIVAPRSRARPRCRVRERRPRRRGRRGASRRPPPRTPRAPARAGARSSESSHGSSAATSPTMWPRTRGITTNGDAEPLRVGDELGRRDGDARGRGRELRDRLLREVVVAERADRRRREAHDELVGLLGGRSPAGPREVDEDGLARVPDGRMLGVDHAHVGVARCAPRSKPPARCRRRTDHDVSGAPCRPLAYIYICDPRCKGRRSGNRS